MCRSSPTAVQWYRRFRDVCSWKLDGAGEDRRRVSSRHDEREWRKQFGSTAQLALLNMQRHIAERYPLWSRAQTNTPGSFQSHPHATEDTHNLNVHSQHYRLHFHSQRANDTTARLNNTAYVDHEKSTIQRWLSGISVAVWMVDFSLTCVRSIVDLWVNCPLWVSPLSLPFLLSSNPYNCTAWITGVDTIKRQTRAAHI